MILASHQPDLLPWTGFWHKMAKADVFDLAIYDQYQRNGYQRRVKMLDKWFGHEIYGDYFLKPITEIELTEGSVDRLIGNIQKRYAGLRYWKTRGAVILWVRADWRRWWKSPKRSAARDPGEASSNEV